MGNYRDFFEEHWDLLQQADLYRLRPNVTFKNPDFEKAPFRVLIVRLSPFSDVDRSTPHLFLYQAVRRALPNSYIDMAFFPPQYDRQRFLEAGVPLLVGVQSFHSVEDFDLVLISNAYTLELINLPYLLLHSDVRMMASQRECGWPVFILGGSNALAVQALITEDGDSLVDAIFFGEGEDAVSELVESLFSAAEKDKLSRLLHAATEVSGLWVAGETAPQHVDKAICSFPQSSDLLVDYPVLNSAEAGTAWLQINYGCPAFCSFCFEGYDRKPYRELPFLDLLEVARELKRSHGARVLELYSFNFNTHADIFSLIEALNCLFERVSFKSQRVDILYETPGLLQAEVIADKRSFTLGIEGISEQQRAFLHKSLSLDDLWGTLASLLQQKIREIKLFYILTGHETESDFAEFRDFVSNLKSLRRRSNPGIRIIFSFGYLIRMPFTPLRYDSLFLDGRAYARLAGLAKSTCETNGFEFRMATPWDEYCTSQVLAMGGYWLHEPLMALAEEGHYYDLGLTPGYWEALRLWLDQHGHWHEGFLGEKGQDYPFPLEFVESAISSEFLYAQYEKAVHAVDHGYCLGGEEQPGYCRGCGACVTAEQRQAILSHRIQQPPNFDYWDGLQQVMQTKWRIKPTYVTLQLPAKVAGVTPEWLNAWVLHALLDAFPEMLDNLLSAEEALFTARENRRRYEIMHGETVFALDAWDPEALLSLLKDSQRRGLPFGYLGPADGFEPGVFQKMTLAARLPVRYFHDFGQRLRDFLRANYVPVNVRRDGDLYRLDLPEKSLKKKVLFEGEYRHVEDYVLARLCVGPKFDLLALLRAFGMPSRYRKGEVAVSDLVY